MRKERPDGFTLIELLVVIAIITAIAALLVPAIQGAIRRAEITRAQNEMHSVASACLSFKETYGLWPVDQNGVPDWTFGCKDMVRTSDGKAQNIVIRMLRGLDTTINRHRTVFLEVPQDSLEGKDFFGDTYTASESYFLDPWDNPYVIQMDTDFDGELGGTGMPRDFRSLRDNYVRAVLSPTGDGRFPGVPVLVLSFGPQPGQTNSLLTNL